MSETYTLVKKEIFKYVVSNGSFTIPVIAGLTGLSTTAVSQYVSRMKDEGIIEPMAREKSDRRGRRATLYSISGSRFHFVGVDIKPFGLTIALADFTGKPLLKEHLKNFTFENTHENLDEICNRVDSFIERSNVNRGSIAAINFNIGGRVDSGKGTSASIFNFEETQSTPLAELLSERLGTTVFIENDTKAMAYGEYSVLNRPHWKNVLFINVGWGLGMGIILNGDIYYGSNGYSGEFGHMPTYDNRILCHCGKKGCLETEISGAAIVRKLTERIRNGETSRLSEKVRLGERITTDDIINATGNEDPLCIELVSRAGRELGRQLAGMINIFNPDCIIIGGSMSRTAPYYFLQHASLAIRQYSLNLMSHGVAIETSKTGDDAGVIGACLIARDRFFFR